MKVLMISIRSFSQSFIKMVTLSGSLGTSSRHYLFPLYLPGGLEDTDVLDGAGDGVRVLMISIRSFTESFI